MGYDQRFNSVNPLLTNRPPLTSAAVHDPSLGPSTAPPGPGAFAPLGGNPPGPVVAPGGYVPQPPVNPMLMGLVQNIQGQQPYMPGSPTAGTPLLGGLPAPGMQGGARGAFSAGGRR